MAIRNRRGSYNDFDPTKAVSGEWLVVTSDHPGAGDGTAVYMAFENGSVKRMATYEDMVANLASLVDDAAAEAVQEAAQAVAVFTGATASANGTTGTVPRPTSGQQNRVLFGDSTWQILSLDQETGINAHTIKLKKGSTELSSIDIAAANESHAGVMTKSDYIKLGGIQHGAEVNVQSDWNETDNLSDKYIKNKPAGATRFTLTHGNAVSWSSATGYYDPYNKTVRIFFAFRAVSTVSTTATLFTIPTSYRPSTNYPGSAIYLLGNSPSIYSCTAGSNGAITQPLSDSVTAGMGMIEYPL